MASIREIAAAQRSKGKENQREGAPITAKLS